jgi:hypothetical protein
LSDQTEAAPSTKLYPSSSFVSGGGKWITTGLFVEFAQAPTHCIFTTKEEDLEKNGKIYQSFTKLYMAYTEKDPTEYILSDIVLGGWDHLQEMLKARNLKGYLLALRSRNAARIKSQAIRHIAEEMNTEGKSSFQAAKLLLDKGWIPAQEKTSRTYKKKDKEEDKEALVLLKDDAKRLGLNLN